MAETQESKPAADAEKKKEQSISFFKLFSFADKYDWLLMAAGSLGAVVHGSAMPVFFLLFGDLVNGFGKNQADLRKMTEEVSKYALYFVYLGLVVCLSSYAEIACWMYTGERQVSTLRKKYLQAVLKQDVGFFDTDARTGDIVFSVSTDTLLVQDAISEKVGNFIHYLSTFLAGLVVGFLSAWRLALLSVAVIPGIAFAGGLYAYTLTGLTSKSRESYANAGIVAEQAIAQVRTVYSFVGEGKALNSYSEAIQNTLKLGYKAGMAKGLGIGCTYGIACMSWALVFWYAGVFIRNGQTDGGKAFTAIFSAIVGGMSLGQSFSNLGAFSKGKTAGYKLMEIIKQKPSIVQDPLDGKCLAEVNGNIEFKEVTFSYPSRPASSYYLLPPFLPPNSPAHTCALLLSLRLEIGTDASTRYSCGLLKRRFLVLKFHRSRIMACRQSIAFRTRSRTATAAAAGIGVPRRRQRKSSVIDDVEKGYVEKRPTFSVVGCVAGRTRSRCVGGAVPQSKASNARKTCVSVVLLSSSSSEEEDGDVRCSTCAVSDNGGGRGSSDDAVTGKKDGYGDSSYEEVGFFDDDSRKDRVSGSGGNGSASEELGSNCSGINRKRTVPESPGIAKRTRSHSHWNRVPKKNPGTLTNPMGLEMNRECPRSELAKSNDFLEGESGRQGDEENDGCCGIDDERDEDDDDSNSDEEYHAFSKDGGNHLSEDDAAVRNDNKYDEENGCMDKEFGVREEGEDHAVDGAIGDDDEHNGGSGKENNFSKDGADHVMDDAEVGGESLAGNRKTEQVQFPKSTESKRACALKDDIFFKLLVDSIWSKEEELQEELAPKDKSPTKSAETPKCLKRFPLQFFWVDDKVPEVEEKTGEEKMLDELWAEFDLAMNSRDLGSFISPEVDHGEKQDAPSTETDRFNFCCKGRHQFVLDEEIGIKCILCPFVKLEIRYILPPMVHKPGKSCRKVIVDDEDRTVFDKLQSQVINEDYQCSIPSEGTVWDIIPGVKKTLYPHQQEGFEFIWKNLAGSIQLEQMKESNPDEVGGCVISHAPGTGKTRLAILFIKTFMAAFPQCRPIILAPYSMLLTWENEFSKWKVNIPFHILNKSEFSGKEDRAALRLGHKKCRKWVRLVKIFSWNKGNSILGLTYNLFERLVGKSSIHDKEYAEMSKILTEKTGLLVLDEGHKPRNDRTLIWKALEKVKTNRRIILSGTPFQNNLGELYNTLCLVRPQFAQKFISKNGYMCQRRLEMHSDNAQALQGRRDAREGWASLTKEQSFDANLEKLRSMMDPFVHVYKGSILNNLPGLRECILVLHPFPLQKRILDRISNGNYGNNFYHEYITSIISVHPSLLLESNLYGKAGLIIEKEQLESLRLNPYEGVKTKFVLELIRLVKSTSEKVLIFSQYIAPLTLLKEQLKYLFDWTVGKELLQMDGEVADINSRQSSIDCFNDPTSEARVLLASTRACGEGINLIGASRVVLLDVVWNPSVKRQAISRAYRLGQEKVVYTYHLITSETIEGDKYHRQSEKDRLCGLLFSSTDGRTQRQHASSKISEDRILTLEEMVRHDRILEEMVGHEKLKGMFKRP